MLARAFTLAFLALFSPTWVLEGDMYSKDELTNSIQSFLASYHTTKNPISITSQLDHTMHHNNLPSGTT